MKYNFFYFKCVESTKIISLIMDFINENKYIKPDKNGDLFRYVIRGMKGHVNPKRVEKMIEFLSENKTGE